MDITGSQHRLTQLFSQLYNLPVQILQILFRPDILAVFFPKHEGIISNRLNLQIIVKVRNTDDLLFCFSLQNRLKQFSRFTG